MMLNPVFRRQSQTVLRSWKTFLIITIYCLIMALIAGVLISDRSSSAYTYGFDPSETVNIYACLVVFQLVFVMLMTPALTAGSISGEKERQTLDLMLITKMRPIAIIWGKLLSSLVVILLMIIASMPVIGVLFYYGGVSFSGLIGTTLYTILLSATLGSIAMLLSSMMKRTSAAAAVTYIAMMAMPFGSFMISYILQYLVLFYWRKHYSGVVILGAMIFDKPIDLYFNAFIHSVNPLMGFISVVGTQFGNHDYAWEIVEDMLVNSYYELDISFLPPLWVFNVIICIFIIWVCLHFAAKNITPVKQSQNKNKK